MPSAKEDDEKQKPHKKKVKGQSTEQNDSSAVQKDDKIKKPTKSGFSILSSLSKFMSNEKPAQPPPPTKPQEPLGATETQSESMLSQENPVPPPQQHEDKSSQTTELKVRRSSTLIAISKALEALKEVRHRVALFGNQHGKADIVQTGQTQTATPQLSIIFHGPDFNLKLKSLQEEDQDTKSSEHYSNSKTAPESKSVSQEGLRDGQVTPKESLSHVSIVRKPDYIEVNIADVPIKKIVQASVENLPKDKKGDKFNSSSSQALSHSAPASGQYKVEIKLSSLETTYNSVNVQTEPVLEAKETQTLLSTREGDTRRKNHLADEYLLVHRMLQNRKKCSKCDLFELMFLHGGEKVLNDKEMVGMFKRHIDSHLLKAQQEDLNKLYQRPRKITEIRDEREERPPLQTATSADRLGETAIRPNNSNDFDESKYREDELARILAKNKIGTPPPERQKIISGSAEDDEMGTNTEKHSNADNFPKTTGIKRDMPERDMMKSRPKSLALEQILEYYLSSIKDDYSDEAIIKRKGHPDGHNNRRDSINSYSYDQHDGYYYAENVGNVRKKSNRQCQRDCRKGGRSRDDERNGYCFCGRSNCIPACCNLINSGHWNSDCSDDDNNDKCNYTRCRVNTNRCLQKSHDEPSRLYENFSSEIELQLKWFIKGLLTALQGHQDVKPTENKQKINSESSENERLKTTRSNSRDKVKVKKFPEQNRGVVEKPNSSGENDQNSTEEEKSMGHKRKGSNLSDTTTFMVKEDTHKQTIPTTTGQTAGGEENQEMKNTEPNSEQYSQQTNKNRDSLVVHKSQLNSGSSNGSNGGSGNEAMLPNNLTLSDAQDEKLVQDILSAFCTESSGREENSQRGGYDAATTDRLFLLASNSDELVQQVCNNILKAGMTVARVPRKQTINVRENEKYRFKGRRNSTEQSNEEERLTCSYFYPFGNDNFCDSFYNQFSDSRSCNQAEPLCSNQNQSDEYNCCSLPVQDGFGRNNHMCYRRVKVRQECKSNCRRGSKQKSQQQQRRQSLVKAITNCSRPSTAAAQYRGNAFGGSSDVGTDNGCGNQDVCEPITYVVPQNQAYWRYF